MPRVDLPIETSLPSEPFHDARDIDRGQALVLLARSRWHRSLLVGTIWTAEKNDCISLKIQVDIWCG